MKKLLLTSAATFLTVAVFGQGQINFNNAATIAGWNPAADRNVKFDATAASVNAAYVAGLNVSSNLAGTDLGSLRAALYYAASTVTDLSQFIAASGASSSFKTSTSATAGSWFGGTRTLDNLANGVVGNLVVFVWDTTKAANPLLAAAQTGLYGHSAIFQYASPTSSTPAPAEFLPNNLAGFTIGIVPEPSTFALAGLGALALMVFRRRK
jgi:hypothetical protein